MNVQLSLRVSVQMARGNESLEQRMRFVWLALKFGVELAGNKERMILQFDDLDQLSVGRSAAQDKPGLLELLAVLIVKFVTVAMPFMDEKCAIIMGHAASNY